MVPVERSKQDEKVVYLLLSNVFELIRHAICVLLDDSHEISLRLNRLCTWPRDSSISMGSANPFGIGGSLLLMVCRSGDAMNYVPSIFTNFTIIEMNLLLMNFFCLSRSSCSWPYTAYTISHRNSNELP